MTASVRWPDRVDGPWVLTAHWAKIDGRAVMVGLDVRSHVDTVELVGGTVTRQPAIGDRLHELTQRVLRGIPISQVRDATRAALLGDSMRVVFSAEPDVAAEPWAAERVRTLTAKGEPRQRREKASEDLLRRVAVLYTQAVEQGDTMPAKYVEDQVRAVEEQLPAGERRLSTDSARAQVRQWIRRARERGYLTIRPPRSEGA